MSNNTVTRSYREVQQALKACREDGITLNVKLNASFETLAKEYERVIGTQVTKTQTKAEKAKASKPADAPTYRQLQAILKSFKTEGKTTVKLNSKYEVLHEEWVRLTSKVAA